MCPCFFSIVGISGEVTSAQLTLFTLLIIFLTDTITIEISCDYYMKVYDINVVSQGNTKLNHFLRTVFNKNKIQLQVVKHKHKNIHRIKHIQIQ